MLDYIRIACAVPAVCVGNVRKNTEDICAYIRKADAQKADIVLFPELALTGYSCQDLFFQSSLLDAVKVGIGKIVSCSAQHPQIFIAVGLPLLKGTQLYDCAALIQNGKVIGLVPKTFLPNYGAFYEKRWFVSGENTCDETYDLSEIGLQGVVPFGNKQLFSIAEGTLVGVEICEDLWSPVPPSSLLAMAGADVILNLSASNETVGKRTVRRDMVARQSTAGRCIYAFCSSGYTESTQDTVFSGHSLIAENGAVLGENANQFDADYMLIRDCDLGIVRHTRRNDTCFADSGNSFGICMPKRFASKPTEPLRADGSLYPVIPMPFMPADLAERKAACKEAFQIQVVGLKQRLALLGAKAVIGVSGGLDSTLALLVAVEAMRQLGRPATDVWGITMPGFGTSGRTYRNAIELIEKLGISSKEISIRESVGQHFEDIGHDPQVHNGTYENAQARERTQILMDFAGMINGIVVGTGDLSELALGWCTYNGDHMSMYGVNASITKTQLQWIISTVSGEPVFSAVSSVLNDILDTPISPELLPPSGQGNISQFTEDLVGPYILHDFFLYYVLRYGFTVSKIYAMACRTFDGKFEKETIRKWLNVFCRRFFTQQFKRSCMPDGVKVGDVSLSPRGDWRMPSDASSRFWLDELENLQ